MTALFNNDGDVILNLELSRLKPQKSRRSFKAEAVYIWCIFSAANRS